MGSKRIGVGVAANGDGDAPKAKPNGKLSFLELVHKTKVEK